MEKEKPASGLALKIGELTTFNPCSCHSLKWIKMQSSPSLAVSSAIGAEFLPLRFHLRHDLRHHRKGSDASCFRGWFLGPVHSSTPALCTNPSRSLVFWGVTSGHACKQVFPLPEEIHYLAYLYTRHQHICTNLGRDDHFHQTRTTAFVISFLTFVA